MSLCRRNNLIPFWQFGVPESVSQRRWDEFVFLLNQYFRSWNDIPEEKNEVKRAANEEKYTAEFLVNRLHDIDFTINRNPKFRIDRSWQKNKSSGEMSRIKEHSGMEFD